MSHNYEWFVAYMDKKVFDPSHTYEWFEAYIVFAIAGIMKYRMAIKIIVFLLKIFHGMWPSCRIIVGVLCVISFEIVSSQGTFKLAHLFSSVYYSIAS